MKILILIIYLIVDFAMMFWFDLSPSNGIIWYLLSGVRASLIFFLLFKDKKSNNQPAVQNLEDRLHETKLLALQMQINPHFLYNTLEGIRGEALLGGVQSAARMSELLAKFFRYNISTLEQTVTVEDELDNLHIYLKIQKYRFADRIQMEINFEGEEEKIKKFPIPKLILQPIVENAILHGLEPLNKQGTINLRFFLSPPNLIIVISDNGVGMEKQQLETLNSRMRFFESSSSSIGLDNVNRRIQLLFGSEYGIRFSSKKNVGTDVEIILPSGINKETFL